MNERQIIPREYLLINHGTPSVQKKVKLTLKILWLVANATKLLTCVSTLFAN